MSNLVVAAPLSNAIGIVALIVSLAAWSTSFTNMAKRTEVDLDCADNRGSRGLQEQRTA